ncbi:aminoglycoside phosphotransferase family protein [Nonomuraea mesophila]|uniref:Aminoglycoside phosphotransferase family protein n=1 Tax=Nonomuraea mesophila TaxID=2530382 RepID=A0A4R5FRI4_9ACTN|nr:aminoglycoside phosphotransferase family protein [Nonomuraea mesophila]TDE55763.1 aminoglycoside phosphotransferase family protein [Nonomuraea mesophila]
MTLKAELAGVAAAYGGTGTPELHPTRTDVMVLRRGEVVVKAHSARDEAEALRPRVRAAASAALSGVMLAPLEPEVLTVAGRAVTVWPAGRPVAHDDPDSAPWEEGARLLARLHAVPLTLVPALPGAGGPARAARAVERMSGDGPVEQLVRRTFKELPETDPQPGLLTHGDWHLGQLVHRGGWLLIDVDDLGVGDPAWDLARPAAWYAAGLLDPDVWARFLGAYQASGGPALGQGDDPWQRLDVPARALTVQLAAVAVVNAERENRELDEVEYSLVEACNRIVRA